MIHLVKEKKKALLVSLSHFYFENIMAIGY